MALAMVMMYDLQDRKFQPREPMTGEEEEPVQEVRLVEDSLFRFLENYSEMGSPCQTFLVHLVYVCFCFCVGLGLNLQHRWLASE